MTEPYSLRTLAAPELRTQVAVVFGGLGLAAVVAGASTATGSVVGLALGLLAILLGLAPMKQIDEKAREIDGQA